MASIDIDVEDYLDEADTDCLVRELQQRKILPSSFKYKENEPDLTCWGKNPKRDLLLSYLDLSPLASLEDMLEAAKSHYFK